MQLPAFGIRSPFCFKSTKYSTRLRWDCGVSFHYSAPRCNSLQAVPKVHVPGHSAIGLYRQLLSDQAGLCNDNEVDTVCKQLGRLDKVDKHHLVANLHLLRRLLGGRLDNVRNVVLAQPRLLLSDLVGWHGLLTLFKMPKASIVRFMLKNTELLATTDPNQGYALLALLREYGLEDEVARVKIFRQYPDMLKLDLESDILPALDILRGIFDRVSPLSQPLTHPASASPPASWSALQPASSPSEIAFRSVVSRFPNFLLYLTNSYINKTLNEKVTYLKDNGLTQWDIGSIIMSYPDFFSVTMETLKPKIKFLQKCGFTGQYLQVLVRDCPQLLGVSKRQLERKWTFLHYVVGLGVEEIAATPAIMAASVFNEVGPAFFYICQLPPVDQLLVRDSNGRIDPLKLLAVARDDGSAPLPSVYCRKAYYRAAAEWCKGPGPGWKDGPKRKAAPSP